MNDEADYLTQLTSPNMATPVAFASDDPFADARAYKVPESNVAPVASDDPFADARNFDVAKSQKEREEKAQSVNNNEPKYIGIHGAIQNLGAEVTPENIKSGLAKVGSIWPESMSPTDIAMLVPETAIGGLAGKGVVAVGNALTRMSPEIAQVVSGSKLLQLGGAGATGAAQMAGFNAAGGNNPLNDTGSAAIINAAVPALGMVGKPIASELANLAKTASDKYGIQIPGALLSNNPLVSRAYSILDRMGMIPKNDNSEKFATSISNTFGENTPKLTRDAMEAAGDNISNMFDEVKANVPNIDLQKPGSQILTRLANAHSNASQAELKPITNLIDRIQDIAANNGGKIPNASWQELTDSNSVLSSLSKESGALGNQARDLKGIMYDALGENASQADLAKFTQAKQYYKNWNTVKNGEDTLYNPVTGEVNPTRLATKVKQTVKKYGDNGLSDLQNLGDIGQQFKLTPSSGSAENYLTAKAAGLIGGSLAGATGVGYHYDPEDTTNALEKLGGAYIGGKLAGKALSSQTYKNMLINNGLSQPTTINTLLASPALSINRQANQ